MTNRERLISLLGHAPSANTVDGALLDYAINSTATYDGTNQVIIKQAAISILQVLLSTADVTQGTGETANAIKYDRDAIMKRIAQLQSEIGETGLNPTITSKSVW